MLEPKEIELDGKIYVISKFPAVAGREIITQYPLTGAPVIGNYKANEALMFKVLSFTAVKLEGRPEPMLLNSQILIDNHVKSWETLMTLEKEMMVYNCSFFQSGRASTFFGGIAQISFQWITKTLIPALAQLSTTEKQPSSS